MCVKEQILHGPSSWIVRMRASKRRFESVNTTLATSESGKLLMAEELNEEKKARTAHRVYVRRLLDEAEHLV